MNPYQLCSRALIKIGANPIHSFQEGTAESDVAGLLYDMTRDGLLSMHPWSFATAHKSLPRLQAPPLADYSYAYQLPVDFLRALSVGNHDLNTAQRGDYRIHQNLIHTDLTQVMLSYIFRPSEDSLPPFFLGALITRLAAEFCLPITENTSRAKELYRLAQDELRLAKGIDSQQQIPRQLSDFTLINVRG